MASDKVTLSSSGLYGGGERGAGGKFRKPPSRRSPSTPYDRPRSRDGGWISKLVGGATRILPSLFSRSPSPAVATVEDLEYIDPEEEENSDEENNDQPSSLGKSESAEETNRRQEVEILNNSSDAFHSKNSLPGGTEFSKIEQLVKEKQFSRDDVNRLVELLHSKVQEASNVEPLDNKSKESFQKECEGSVLAHEIPKLLFKEKQEPLHVAGLRTPMPSFQSKVEEVGASPIDIARAYMGNRGSDISTDYNGTMSKYGGERVRNDRYASQSLVPSPSLKTSACWPGAMAEDRFGHSTPQSVSSRYGLHQFQRTPYSRSIYSKSKSKLAHPEAGSKRFQNFPSSTRLQPQTPIFGRSEHIHNEISGSVGPMRRLRSKFLSEASPRGSTSYLSSQNGHSPMEITNSFLPTTKNLDFAASKATTEFFPKKSITELGPTLNGSESGLPDFQTSNPAVRAILEHLDRHVSTPKEKLAELQFATSSNKPSFSKLNDTVIKEGNDETKLSFEDRMPQERKEAADVDKATNTSTTVNGNYDYLRKSSNEAFSFGLSNSKANNTDNQLTFQSQNKEQSITNNPLNSTIPESLKRPPHHPSGTKPNLASISIDRPQSRQTFFSNNNNSGFTFPVSSTSGALPEPPTPSIMPSSTADIPHKKNDGHEIPNFSFGEKRLTPRLKFSFPSTSNASAQDEVSDIKFSFGADNKSRLSFNSIGKDAIRN